MKETTFQEIKVMTGVSLTYWLGFIWATYQIAMMSECLRVEQKQRATILKKNGQKSTLCEFIQAHVSVVVINQSSIWLWSYKLQKTITVYMYLLGGCTVQPNGLKYRSRISLKIVGIWGRLFGLRFWMTFLSTSQIIPY